MNARRFSIVKRFVSNAWDALLLVDAKSDRLFNFHLLYRRLSFSLCYYPHFWHCVVSAIIAI
jgi:hypothetical protein